MAEGYKELLVGHNFRRPVRNRFKRASVCFWCNKSFSDPSEITIDHLIPRSKGGTNNLANLVPSCRKCNQKRANALPPSWKDEEFKARIQRVRQEYAEALAHERLTGRHP